MTESVRLAVYNQFARTGIAPNVFELVKMTEIGIDQIRLELSNLHASHDLVLDEKDKDCILMAHPFSSIPMGFSVMGSSTLWWGGCAWDAFALPHLLKDDAQVLVATRCPACDEALAWVVGRNAPPKGNQVAHFLVPMQRAWDDVVHTCSNQRLFCYEECVGKWLQRMDLEWGYSMDLGTLWRLASGWYKGRMEPNYRRQDPLKAKAYFAEVGLKGPFWGLPDGEDSGNEKL